MAKRTPPEEQEYRPVNEQLARDVLAGRRQVTDGNTLEGESHEVAPPAPLRVVEPTQESDERPAQEKVRPKTLTERRKRAGRGGGSQKEPIRARRKELVCEKRMLLTASEDQLFEELVSGVTRNLRVKVKASNVLRACLTLLIHVQDELFKQCRRMEPLQRPRYEDPTSIVAFEEELARIFDSAIRNTKSLD